MKSELDHFWNCIVKLLTLLILLVFFVNFKVSVNVNYRDLYVNNMICERFYKIIGKLNACLIFFCHCLFVWLINFILNVLENEYKFSRENPEKYLDDLISMNRYLGCNFDLKEILFTLKSETFQAHSTINSIRIIKLNNKWTKRNCHIFFMYYK